MQDNEHEPACSNSCGSGCCRRALRWLWRLVLAAAVTVAILVVTPAGDWLGAPLVRADPLEKADYIVVLGGAPERAVEAARLYRDGWAPKIILSSTDEGTDYLADIAKAYGAPPDALILDRQSRRTADHPDCVAAAAALDRAEARLIVVTSSYHTRRSLDVFVKAGYRHVLMRPPGWAGGGDFPERTTRQTRWRELPAILHEWIGRGYYALRGWA